MISWELLRARVTSEMASMQANASLTSAQAHEKLARVISMEYDKAVRNGKEPLTGATLLTANVAALKNNIISGMALNDATLLLQAIMTGVVAYWTGATLKAPVTPPSGHVGMSPQTPVLFPGAPVPIIPIPPISPAPTLFVNSIITSFTTHITTISGIHPFMLLPSPMPPYPLPWMGLI